jgi:histidine triad (HIT) family protein
MDKCLFCQIANKEIPSKIVYQDEEIVVFPDIKPKAPVHLLIVPQKHIASVSELKKDDIPLVGRLIYRAKLLAEEKRIANDGYRLVFNCRAHAGQVIDHLHLHLIGGKPLGDMV